MSFPAKWRAELHKNVRQALSCKANSDNLNQVCCTFGPFSLLSTFSKEKRSKYTERKLGPQGMQPAGPYAAPPPTSSEKLLHPSLPPCLNKRKIKNICPHRNSDLFSRRFREGISFPNFVERCIPELPLSKLCPVPFSLQNRALFEGEKRAKRCRKKGRKRAGQQRGKKGKKDARKQVRTSYWAIPPILLGRALY